MGVYSYGTLFSCIVRLFLSLDYTTHRSFVTVSTFTNMKFSLLALVSFGALAYALPVPAEQAVATPAVGQQGGRGGYGGGGRGGGARFGGGRGGQVQRLYLY
jgi:uncharacterized membrane protein YgcG